SDTLKDPRFRACARYLRQVHTAALAAHCLKAPSDSGQPGRRAMHWSKTRVDLALATGAEVVQKLAGYAVLAILARHFEKADMGRLFFAMALTSVIAAATELGTCRHLVREVAVRPEVALRRLGEVVALRAPLIIGAFLLLAGAVSFTRPALAPIVLPAAAAGLLNDLSY